jgi:hypothetical protein
MAQWRKADAEGNLAAVLGVEALLVKVEGTAWRPTDEVAGGNVEIVVDRARNPDIPSPEWATRKKRRGCLPAGRT